MSRGRRRNAGANHERWLVSYADFITLLFAFFVVMFASAQSDRSKANRVSESVRKALEDGQVTSVLSGILGNRKTDQPPVYAAVPEITGGAGPRAQIELTGSLAELQSALQPEIEKGALKITVERRGVVISLRDAAFFDSAEDTVYPGTLATVQKIAVYIRKRPEPVRLEGHTDSLPIHNSRFRSNWELSVARGIAMLEMLVKFGVRAERLAVVGYAENMPIESNDSEQGRAHNRRVDIVILNIMEAPLEEKRRSLAATPPPK
ncbi:MAG: flagellar motor protein MotB [Bryobacteraceae bacterium]